MMDLKISKVLPMRTFFRFLLLVLFTSIGSAVSAQDMAAAQRKCVEWGFKEKTASFEDCVRQNLKSAGGGAPPKAPAPGLTDSYREDVFWADTRSVANKAAFEAYLQQYPRGRYAGLARANLSRLSDESVATTQSEPTPVPADAHGAKPADGKGAKGGKEVSGPPKLKNKSPDSPRFEYTYHQLKKDFLSNLMSSKKVMSIQIAIMTRYDDRVFENVDKHEAALRSVVLGLMRQTTDVDLVKPEFRKNLAIKIRDAMNSLLEKLEDFGGIEEVFFTSFVVQ